MKKILNLKILLLFAVAPGCIENTGSNGRQPSRPDSSQKVEAPVKETAASIKKDELIDDVNYAIVSFTLKDSAAALKRFSEATKENKTYQAIDSVLDTMNLAKTVMLSKEINGLKKDEVLQKKPDSLWPVYLSKTIFQDTARYQKIYAFYKSRAADSAALAELQEALYTEAATKVKEIKEDENSFSGILLISLVILAAAIVAGLIIWKKGKKKTTTEKIPPATGNIAPTRDNMTEERNDLQTENNDLKKENRNLKEDNEDLRRQLQALKSTIQADSFMPQPEAKPATAVIMYFPAPANNYFPDAAGSSNRRSLDAYQLEIAGSKALCRIITEDKDVEKRALDSPDIYILPLYEITPESTQFGRAAAIKILEPCVLQKDGSQWTLKAKGLVKLV